MRLDDYTEARIAEYPAGASSTVVPLESMLTGLDGIWANAAAAQFSVTTERDRSMLRMAAKPWQGAGGPKTMRGYKGTAGGQGEYRTAARFNARPLTIPIVESTRNRAQKTKLLGLMWPSSVVVSNVAWPKLLVAGFRRETQANSRYLLDVTDEGSFEKSYRGREDDAQSPLQLKSTWPWYVVPRTAVVGTPFTPAGEGSEIIWGVRWTSAVTTQITIRVTGNGRNDLATYPIPTGGFGTPFFCLSPPFRTIEGGALPTSAGTVPPYLYRGQAYTIAVTPAAGASVFYFENYGGI